MKSILVGKSISMPNFSPKGLEPIVSVRLKNMVAFLVNKLSAFIVEIKHINFVLTGQEGLCLFPVVHRVNKHSLQLLNCVVQPKYISEIKLIDSSEIDFVIKVMCRFDYVQKLFWQLVVVFESLNSSVDIIVVVILDDSIDLIV